MTDNQAAGLPHMPIFARSVHKLAVPIVLFWIGLVVVLSVLVPPLDKVAKQHQVSMSPQDAPSMQAMKRVGKVFNEFNSDSSAMIVLEGDKPLGEDAHHYYDQIIAKLDQDKKHVQHVQDFWGIRSPRQAHKAPTAKPPTCRCISPVTRAKASPASPSRRSARSWTVCPPRPASRPM